MPKSRFWKSIYCYVFSKTNDSSH